MKLSKKPKFENMRKTITQGLANHMETKIPLSPLRRQPG